MDKYSGLPTWVQKSKKTLRHTQEWHTFTMKLYDMVHHQMQEMGVSTFHDLSPQEKQVLLQRGFHALRKTEAYHSLLEVVSETLDESVSREADKLSKTTIQTKSRVEILQEECGKAVTALLQKWPDSKSSLRQCLNVDIPLELRYVMWKNFLKNQKVKEEYLLLVASNPKKLASSMDFEISQKCKMLLESDPTLKEIPNKSFVYSAMKHVLSYYHSKVGGRDPLVETDFLLAVPVVVCTLAAKRMLIKGEKNEKNLTTEALGTLVEEFLTFMDRRPAYMMSLKDPTLTELSQKMGTIIQSKDPALANKIENYKVEGKQLTEKKLETALSFLLHPIVRSLFVGYFPIDTVLHMWDVYILGFDHIDYDPIPQLCATFFLIIRRELSACQSDREASAVIVKRCRNIQKEQIISGLQEYEFEKQLKESLNIAEEDHFPAFHPALKSNLAPWKYWYSDKIIGQMQKEQQERSKEHLPPGESSRSSHEPADDLRHVELTKLELAEEAARLRAERDSLAEDIEKERRLRVEMQQHADDEIERLQRRLDVVEKKVPPVVPDAPKPEISTQTTTPTQDPPKEAKEKANTPAASPEPKIEDTKKTVPKSPSPIVEKPKTPAEIPKEKIKAQKISDDFVNKMMDTMKFFAQGSVRDQKQLAKATEKDLTKLIAANKKAELAVYGKAMTDADLAALPTEEREQKADKLQKETLRILFKRK